MTHEELAWTSAVQARQQVDNIALLLDQEQYTAAALLIHKAAGAAKQCETAMEVILHRAEKKTASAVATPAVTADAVKPATETADAVKAPDAVVPDTQAKNS